MKRLSVLAITLASLLAFVAAAPAAPPVPILVELPGSDLLYVVISFRAGSADDPAGREGLAAAASTLVEQGIGRALEEKAPAAGAVFRCLVDKDLTTFYFKCHRDTFGEAYPVFAGKLLKPDVGAKPVAAAIEALVAAREQTFGSGEEISKIALDAFLFRGHPYGHPVFGTKAGLAAITPSDVRKFLRERYTAGNLELGLASANPPYLLATVSRDLQRLPAAGRPGVPVPAAPAFSGVRVLLVKKDLPTAAVAFGFPHDVTRAGADYPALLAANAGFGQHRCLTGLLFAELRGVRGLNYGDYSYLERFVEGGQDKMPEPRVLTARPVFSVWIRNLDERNAVFALKYALRALRALPQTVAAGDFLAKNRDFIANYQRLFAYDPFQKLGFRMDDAALGAPDGLAAMPDRLAKLTPEEASAAVGRHLSGRDVRVAIVTSDPEAMKKRLLGAAEARPFYRTEIPPAARAEDEAALALDLQIAPDAIEIVHAEDL